MYVVISENLASVFVRRLWRITRCWLHSFWYHSRDEIRAIRVYVYRRIIFRRRGIINCFITIFMSDNITPVNMFKVVCILHRALNFRSFKYDMSIILGLRVRSNIQIVDNSSNRKTWYIDCLTIISNKVTCDRECCIKWFIVFWRLMHAQLTIFSQVSQ